MMPLLHPSWLEPLKEEFEQPYMAELQTYLRNRAQAGADIFPSVQDWFAALEHCPFPAVKVVLLGQDPYHGPGQAHGLSFSVKEGVPPPPSLQNIFKELESDLGVKNEGKGHLLSWAQQGVLLLNSVLTVERGLPGSHAGRGWETFTDRIIEILTHDPSPKVFLLWGSYAQKKAAFMNETQHLVLRAPHPSPLSAYRGFFGSRPFSKTNEFLRSQGRAPIEWQL